MTSGGQSKELLNEIGFESNLKNRRCLCESTLLETVNQLRKEMREKTFAMRGHAEKSVRALGP